MGLTPDLAEIMVYRNVLIALALTAVVVAAADFSEVPSDELVEIPPMPPMADEAVREEDPTAAKLLQQEEAEDPVLNFLDDAMMKTGPFMAHDTRVAMDRMDRDMASQHKEEMEIAKSLQKREKASQHHRQALDRFAALRSKYATFAESSAPTEDFVEHKKKRAHKGKRSRVHKLIHKGPWTKPHRKPFRAPETYSAVPKGAAEKKAAAVLAKGAKSWQKEDLKVHRETYRELHPGAFWHKKKAVKKIKRRAPTPLKDAVRSNHRSLETIRKTRGIIHKRPKRLSLKGAKFLCKKVKAQAKKKCAAGRESKDLFCKTHGTTAVACSKRGMKTAADCKVAHQTAYNNCLSLWKRAKKNIADHKKRLAAPMTSAKSRCSGKLRNPRSVPNSWTRATKRARRPSKGTRNLARRKWTRPSRTRRRWTSSSSSKAA